MKKFWVTAAVSLLTAFALYGSALASDDPDLQPAVPGGEVIELHPALATQTVTQTVQASTLEPCATARVGLIWQVIGEDRGWWWWFYAPWEPHADDCFMNLLLQVGDSNVMHFSHMEMVTDGITCTGHEARLECSATGVNGSQIARVRLEGVNRGTTVVTLYDPSTGLNLSYPVGVAPGFLYNLPWIGKDNDF